MTPLQAVLGALVGCGLVIAGVAVLAGLGWALIAAGVLLVAAVVLLYDADDAGAA